MVPASPSNVHEFISKCLMPTELTEKPQHHSLQRLRVRGTVQGVGFRPFVWQLATSLHLRGRVCNDNKGVLIEIWGQPSALQTFQQQLQSQAPPLAVIEAIDLEQPAGNKPYTIPEGFTIETSQATGLTLSHVSPDAAICQQCLQNIQDPNKRRYRYPFTNCSHCGPRFSVIKTIPYDRVNTSMAAFKLCQQCKSEYENPTDRRFHAQPIACPQCGPRVWLEQSQGDFQKEDAIAQAVDLLRQGQILAIKGIGGFHLACDAANESAVAMLRQRKGRYHKPFALMAHDMAMIKRYVRIGEVEQQALAQSTAPIVLLRKIKSCAVLLPEQVAPQQDCLGFMLPYSPLHELLLRELDTPLVMTSGNANGHAPCTGNQQARVQLGAVADCFLMHDRDIVNRVDDSVVQVIAGKTRVLRRARGMAPKPLPLPEGFHSSQVVLAMGAELKNTFCLVTRGQAVVSQHLGDLQLMDVIKDYQASIDRYLALFDHEPSVIAIDQHPQYFSSHYGQQLSVANNLPLIKVQHHHAHIAACMAEHGLPLNTEPVLGIVLDGLGYADHDQWWGGEFLLADYRGFKRLGYFDPVAMPGGNRAMLEPWRNTFAHLHRYLGWQQVQAQYAHLPFVRFMQQKSIEQLHSIIAKGINSPESSSAGRLFDAVAALLGLCEERISFEGQAAMALEACARSEFADSEPYSLQLHQVPEQGAYRLGWQRLWQELLQDLGRGESTNRIAARFHRTLVLALLSMVEHIRRQQPVSTVVLSGGVMQNSLLLTTLIESLENTGLQVLVPQNMPANDGGISLGQAMVALAQVT